MATMTKEALTAMIKDAIIEQLAPLGEQINEKTLELVDQKVKEYLKEVKPKVDPDEESAKRTAGNLTAGFKCFTEFAQAVAKSTISGRITDKRLEALEEKAAGTGSVETDGEYGGYLVPEEYRQDLLQKAIEKSNILNLATTIPMATNAINIPYIKDSTHASGTTHGGIQFKWLDEEAAIDSSRPKFGKIQLRLKKCAGLCYVTDELLQDSPISMEPLLTQLFTDAFAWNLDNVFINGTGAGQPMGILNAPCLVSVSGEAGQTTDTVVFENIINMYKRLYNKANGVWFANHDTFAQLASMVLQVGTGGVPVWMPAGGISGKPYDTLMGKPLIFSEHCGALGDAGDVILADFSQYLVGQKNGAGAGMQFASSIHLKFDYDQTAFRFTFRIDGQPWWASALTPRYSTVTVSPFIALAAI